MELLLAAIVLLACLASVKGVRTDKCQTEVTKGQQATLTFYFDKDFNSLEGKSGVTILHYGTDVSLPPETVGECYVFSNGLNCVIAPGFEFDKRITNHMTISIPNVAMHMGGKYAVTLNPSVPGFDSSCVLSVKDRADIPENPNPPHPVGKNDQEPSGYKQRDQKPEPSVYQSENLAENVENLVNIGIGVIILGTGIAILLSVLVILKLMKRYAKKHIKSRGESGDQSQAGVATEMSPLNQHDMADGEKTYETQSRFEEIDRRMTEQEKHLALLTHIANSATFNRSSAGSCEFDQKVHNSVSTRNTRNDKKVELVPLPIITLPTVDDSWDATDGSNEIKESSSFL